MKENRKGMLWYLVNGAVELNWFLGWAMFSSLAAMKRPFPFFETLLAFTLAVWVTRLATGKGWRIISVLGIEILGLAGAALLLIHGIYHASDPLWDSGWLTAFLRGARGVGDWLILSLNLILILLLWALGAALARRPGGFDSACNRFDLGLGAFFALFIIKLVALTKGEVIAGDTLSLLFVFPFFLFGLLSIGMARMEGAAAKAFLPGYRGIGVIASFVAAVLLGAGGVLLFLLPGLKAAAEVGYDALAAAGRPLFPVLVAVLRFLFGPRSYEVAEVATGSSRLSDLSTIAPQTQGWFMELLNRVLHWGLWGMVLLMLLLALAVICFYVIKWLLSRTEGTKEQRKMSFPSWLAGLIRALQVFWAGIRRKMVRGIRGYPRAAGLYGALLGWAGRSGLAHDSGETPLEFGMRLRGRFPELTPQIDRIIGAYNREVYGERVLSGTPLAEANAAWRFLRSPRWWPVRLKGLLSGPPSAREQG